MTAILFDLNGSLLDLVSLYVVLYVGQINDFESWVLKCIALGTGEGGGGIRMEAVKFITFSNS